MARKGPARKAGRSRGPDPGTRRGQETVEVVYDRVTGRSEEVLIRSTPVGAPVSRMTLRLRSEQRQWLDDVSAEIAQTTGMSMSRAAIVRTVLDAITASGLRLGRCRSEAEIKGAILKRLKVG